MKLPIPLFTLFLGLILHRSGAQTTAWFAADTVTGLTINGRTLTNPWAGGLNALQFSATHLNNDGVEDLVVFDRTTSKVSTFLADKASKSYKYRPEYEARFPAITNWMLLVDYDNDGHKELFTFIQQGVRVFRRKQAADGEWSWQLKYDHLRTRGLSGNSVNLQIVAADIPALVDFDGDGDMDIISFEAQGDYAELNQNVSMEKYGVPDSLEFVRNGICWGNFRKHECGDFELGVNCGVSASRLSPGLRPAAAKHAGNSMLLQDLNGDGKKDLLFGHVSCENLSILTNSGAGLNADFTSFSGNYPESNPARFPYFPAAYMEDVDFDGVKDLLVSPNVYANDGGTMNFRASAWYYQNKGAATNPDFVLKQKDFLQDQMLDAGENAAPSFFDVDGDGKKDLVLGTGGVARGEKIQGALWVLKNTGTPENPAFEPQTEDYLGLSAILDQVNLQPQWADFDGDGVPDLGIAGVLNRFLRFQYIPNRARKGEAAQLNPSEMVQVTLPTELTATDKLYFYDADADGDPDLLVGGTLGNLSYYENTGSSANPAFQLRNPAFAGVSPSFGGRYATVTVADLDLDGTPDLLTADISGKIKIRYAGTWGNWSRQDTLVVLNELDKKPYAPSLGNYLHVTATDLNGDGKPDLAVGTHAGGMYLFRNVLPVTITGTEPDNSLRVYPNPAHLAINVRSNIGGKVEIVDASGRAALRHPLHAQAGIPLIIPVKNWPAGLYILRFTGEKTTSSVKVIVH